MRHANGMKRNGMKRNGGMPRIPHSAETKGAKSKTHKGELDYTTKRSDKDFHRNHHDIVMSRRPFHKAVSNQLHGSFRH